MGARWLGSLLLLFLGVPICSSQTAPPAGGAGDYVTITLPVGVRSETIFVRYVLDEDFGGWLQPREGVSSYFISTSRQGPPANRFRAMVYAPGCMIQTIDLPILRPAVPQFSFVCQPLPNVTLTGSLIKPVRLDGREVNIQVKYVARWAQRFLGLDDRIITDIPLGGTQPASAHGAFPLIVPDLSEDPLAGTPDHPGEFQILGRDPGSGKIVALIIPITQSLRTRMGGLQIRKQYPEPIKFAPCSGPHSGLQPHDEFGFTLRPDPFDPCL
jgi:hypothetical protein